MIDNFENKKQEAEALNQEINDHLRLVSEVQKHVSTLQAKRRKLFSDEDFERIIFSTAKDWVATTKNERAYIEFLGDQEIVTSIASQLRETKAECHPLESMHLRTKCGEYSASIQKDRVTVFLKDKHTDSKDVLLNLAKEYDLHINFEPVIHAMKRLLMETEELSWNLGGSKSTDELAIEQIKI